MKILKFRSDDGTKDIFIPTELINKYHSESKTVTQIFCSDDNYKLPINTEELLKRIYQEKPDEFEIIAIPSDSGSNFDLKDSMKYK